MTRMDKEAIYDEMCGLLTDYEGMNGEERKEEVGAEELYYMLVKIQNNWEQLTGDEDD